MTPTPSFALQLRTALCICILFTIFLDVLGVWVVPTALKASSNGQSGLLASLAILCVYLGVSYFAIKPTAKYNSNILRYAFWIGLLAGLIFALEIILEYVLLPGGEMNSRMGMIEFGSVLFLYFVAGFWGTYQTNKYLASMLTAMWCALIASLIWFTVVLLVYYLFHGTDRQSLILQAEGDMEDFKRSGMSDLDAFVMQDFWGAGFFHLLLGPVVAGILGTLGGLFGYLFLKFFHHRNVAP